MGQILHVLPGELRLPHSRASGAVPSKLAVQIARFGASADGMPPVLVTLAADNEMMILDGATRATRIAKLAPGATNPVEILDEYPGKSLRHLPRKGAIMSTDVVEQIAQKLVELHRLFPEMRFGQLVLTVVTAARGPDTDSTYEVTDEELLAAAQRLIERNGGRAAAVSAPAKKRVV